MLNRTLQEIRRIRGRAAIWPVLLASLCALVLATRVHVQFERVRYLVVTAPLEAHDTALTIALPDLSAAAGSPLAIVARIRSAQEGPTLVEIRFDRQPVASVRLPAGQLKRLDAAAALDTGAGHALLLTGNRPGWRLEYLEVSNAHGFTRGWVDLVIAPAARGTSGEVPVWAAAAMWIVLLLARPRLRRPHRSIAGWIHVVATGVVLLFFGCLLGGPVVTHFKPLLAWRTFTWCAVVLYAEPLWRLWRFALFDPGQLRPFLRYCPHVAIGALFVAALCQFYEAKTGFTRLIVFGDEFDGRAIPALRGAPHAVEPGAGYDGQFYAQLALDPLVRSDEIVKALDAPGYRARRILVPWAAYVLGLGRPAAVLQAFALVNALSWLVLAWLLLRWLPAGSVRATLAWAGCMLAPGLLSSVRMSVPDGPSLLLLAVAVLVAERGRPWVATSIVGLSGLARETNLLGGVIALWAPGETQRRPGRLALRLILLAAPLAAWVAYLSALGFLPGSAGIRNFALPLVGYVDKLQTTLAELYAGGWQWPARFSLLTLVALAVQMVVLVWQWDWRSRWWQIGVAYASLMVVLGPAVWEGSPGAVIRVVLPLTIAFNVHVWRLRWFWPLWIAGNINLVDGLDALHASQLLGTLAGVLRGPP